MADQASSFIPKNSNRVERKVRTTKRIYLLSYVSYIVFFGTLLLVVGVYIYNSQIESELASVKQEVQTARERFAPAESIEEIKLLDRQLKLTEQMINSSAAPSRIFEDIQAVTAQNIQFTGFLYEYMPNRQFKVTLSGLADNFNEVLYQAELMKGSSLLQDGYVMGYDYSLGQAESALGSATLTFVFTDMSDIGSIPYVPAVTSSPNTDNSGEQNSNQVLEISASEETAEAGVTTDDDGGEGESVDEAEASVTVSEPAGSDTSTQTGGNN